ncbi:hypothetical protein RvY_04777 [Ramazzottius varieornatus]|uniref:Uncharacterized protein n=1 Tax=Ramazzottius varieornatus TaxID=947166 RepID=A0A1D1UW12_RAMVA|nr:hypothetical protein RvY_04777 [Ramazzottius varieornatus]
MNMDRSRSARMVEKAPGLISVQTYETASRAINGHDKIKPEKPVKPPTLSSSSRPDTGDSTSRLPVPGSSRPQTRSQTALVSSRSIKSLVNPAVSSSRSEKPLIPAVTEIDSKAPAKPVAVDGAALPKRPPRGSFNPDRSRKDQIKYFRDLIDDTTLHMSTMADKWEHVLNNPSSVAHVSEEGVELIRLAVGQSRLFLSKKLQQFVGLVDDCEFHRGERETSPMDLAGFWEMIDMQVVDIHARFDKVEALAANKWRPEVPSKCSIVGKASAVPAKKVLKPLNINAKPKATAGATERSKSSIREAIEQKRKEKMAATSSHSSQESIEIVSKESPS